MNDPFVKFPSTPHLAILTGHSVRDDKVFSVEQRGEFLRHEIIVEEKVDGANLGISFDGKGICRCQNRGAYIQAPFVGQWKGMGAWIDEHRAPLFDVLTDQYILFGEWCRAVHSVFYDNLPDWFLGFDLYDRTSERFLSPQERDRLIGDAGLEKVPQLERGVFNLHDLEAMMGTSRIGHHNAEGVYLRSANDKSHAQRAKLVRPEFVQSIHEHWSRREIRYNQLAS